MWLWENVRDDIFESGGVCDSMKGTHFLFYVGPFRKSISVVLPPVSLQALFKGREISANFRPDNK